MPPPLSRRRFLQGVAASAVLGCERPGRAERPNLLLILSDDQRADTLGCMGNSRIRTPNLDALAADGVVFENAFVTTSICPTSRASILTGQHMRRHGIRDFGTSLSPAALTRSYPARIRAEGYHTGFVGKWGVAALPENLFDVLDAFEGQGRYRQEVEGESRHLTELIAEDAVAYLEQQSPERPFCLSVSFKAPHGPWIHPDPEFFPLYADAEVPLPDTATPEAHARLPATVRASDLARRGLALIENRPRRELMLRGYWALITGLDDAVGRILAALDRLDLARDTVVIFSSDNGILLFEHGLIGKWLMYEGSIRVPLLVRDPRLPAERRGRRVTEMALNVDLAPTLLELAGVAPLPGMQGRSLLPLLRGTHDEWREDWFYEYRMPVPGAYLPAVEGVREERFKYMRYLDPDPQVETLYDLAADPAESHDLAGDPEFAATLARLRARWQVLRRQAGQPDSSSLTT